MAAPFPAWLATLARPAHLSLPAPSDLRCRRLHPLPRTSIPLPQKLPSSRFRSYRNTSQLKMKDSNSAPAVTEAAAAAPVPNVVDPTNGSGQSLTKKRAVPVDGQGEAPLKVMRINDAATLPVRGSDFAAGYDIAAGETKEIAAGERAVVKTGLKIAVPQGCYGRVAPRSGLAVKKGIDVGAGVIDADYRGELGVVLFNFGKDTFTVSPGDRIAQLVLERIATPAVEEVKELDETVRGEGGFGSTGVGAPAEASA